MGASLGGVSKVAPVTPLAFGAAVAKSAVVLLSVAPPAPGRVEGSAAALARAAVPSTPAASAGRG